MKPTKENILEAIDSTIAWVSRRPDNLIGGECAQNQKGARVEPTDPSACKFCSFGFIAMQAGIRGEARTSLDCIIREIIIGCGAERNPLVKGMATKSWQGNDDYALGRISLENLINRLKRFRKALA